MIKELAVYMIYGSAFIGLVLMICLIGEKIDKIKKSQKDYENNRLALRQERLKEIREKNKKKHKKLS